MNNNNLHLLKSYLLNVDNFIIHKDFLILFYSSYEMVIIDLNINNVIFEKRFRQNYKYLNIYKDIIILYNGNYIKLFDLNTKKEIFLDGLKPNITNNIIIGDFLIYSLETKEIHFYDLKLIKWKKFFTLTNMISIKLIQVENFLVIWVDSILLIKINLNNNFSVEYIKLNDDDYNKNITKWINYNYTILIQTNKITTTYNTFNEHKFKYLDLSIIDKKTEFMFIQDDHLLIGYKNKISIYELSNNFKLKNYITVDNYNIKNIFYYKNILFILSYDNLHLIHTENLFKKNIFENNLTNENNVELELDQGIYKFILDRQNLVVNCINEKSKTINESKKMIWQKNDTNSSEFKNKINKIELELKEEEKYNNNLKKVLNGIKIENQAYKSEIKNKYIKIKKLEENCSINTKQLNIFKNKIENLKNKFEIKNNDIIELKTELEDKLDESIDI